jgi:hypothetical protein
MLENLAWEENSLILGASFDAAPGESFLYRRLSVMMGDIFYSLSRRHYGVFGDQKVNS